jgi:hypothetical protein
VGVAVRAGSYGRGGPRYQALAVFITYSAIVSTYVPLIVIGLKEKWTETQKAESSKGGGTASSAAGTAAPEPGATTPDAGGALAEGSTGPRATEVTAAEQASAEPVSVAQAIVAVGLLFVFVVGLAYVAPFLGGFENIIGLAIIAFGVWEAWKINRRASAEISGPWSVTSPASSPAAGSATPSTGE